jgi:hypothetical protein
VLSIISHVRPSYSASVVCIVVPKGCHFSMLQCLNISALQCHSVTYKVLKRYVVAKIEDSTATVKCNSAIQSQSLVAAVS